MIERVYQYNVVKHLQTVPQCTSHPFCCVVCLSWTTEVVGTAEVLQVLLVLSVISCQVAMMSLNSEESRVKCLTGRLWVHQTQSVPLFSPQPRHGTVWSHFTSWVPVSLWPITLFASICWLCTVTTSRLYVIPQTFFFFLIVIIILWCHCFVPLFLCLVFLRNLICWLAQLYVWCCMTHFVCLCFCACCHNMVEIQNRNGHLMRPQIFSLTIILVKICEALIVRSVVTQTQTAFKSFVFVISHFKA